MTTIGKPVVTLGGVPLAAKSGIAWRFQAGVTPYQTTVQVHKSKWPQIDAMLGQPQTLTIKDSRGVETRIQQVYPLHVVPSDSPNRVSFVIADKRWRWSYRLIARDYNMTRKTGSRTAFNPVPVEQQIVVDKFDYYAYSIDGDRRWSAQRAVEDVLNVLEEGSGTGQYRIDSWPIGTAGSELGQITLQNVSLRDAGDAALSRLLEYVPGASVFIAADGTAVVYDATDLQATEAYFANLPLQTWEGDHPVWVDRSEIRPSRIRVHYQREMEVLFEYEDNYGATTATWPGSAEPFLENVLPTVDPTTRITTFDPETNTVNTVDVPAGTWVPVQTWLAAMDADRPQGSLPWTWETIRQHWVSGDLEGVLGVRGLDLDEEANVTLRYAALREHFRQTFRVNRRYMERVRDLQAVRVALLDPVTGARGKAAVWGQACHFPSDKGKLIAARGTDDGSKLKVIRNVDYYSAPGGGLPANIVERPPGPTAVQVLDKELGILHIQWLASPYGTTQTWVPCHLVGERSNQPQAITRDLGQQDTEPIGVGLHIEAGANGIWLAPTMRMALLLTIVPAAPNNEKRFHVIEVEPGDINRLFRREFRIGDGFGPVLDYFVPPGEQTARYAWRTSDATQTIQAVLGVDGASDPGWPAGQDLPGFVLVNDEGQGGGIGRHLSEHARAVAAELLTPFADNVQGNVATHIPQAGVQLVGNMAQTTISVGAAPSGRVVALHGFPGQARPISRHALMSDAARQVILGTLPFR